MGKGAAAMPSATRRDSAAPAALDASAARGPASKDKVAAEKQEDRKEVAGTASARLESFKLIRGSWDAAVVAESARKAQLLIQRWYGELLKNNPTLAGKLTVTLSFDASALSAQRLQ